MVFITKKLDFCASHRLYNPAFSDEKNQEIFGLCNNPNGHGHNYTLEVTVAGKVVEETGMVLDLKALKGLVQREVIDKVDHKNLNVDVTFLTGIIPTAENLAVKFWDILEPHVQGVNFTRSNYSNPNATLSSIEGNIVKDLISQILLQLGEDPSREGLQNTPERVQKSLQFLTSGYMTNIKEIVNNALFENHETDEMVIVRDIELYSLCEHHMLPFFGKAHIAYLPKGRIIGLSKIPRIVDAFSRRLQVQENLTTQIANCLQETLNPQGVAVVIEAHHLCMAMRGVQKQNSYTTTSSMLGLFKEDPRTRGEFLSLIRGATGPSW